MARTVSSAHTVKDILTGISHRRSAEDFRPEDGQSLLARVRQARKYAKEADKALQNIEVVVHVAQTYRCSRLFCRPSYKRDASFPMAMRIDSDFFFRRDLVRPDIVRKNQKHVVVAGLPCCMLGEETCCCTDLRPCSLETLVALCITAPK